MDNYSRCRAIRSLAHLIACPRRTMRCQAVCGLVFLGQVPPTHSLPATSYDLPGSYRPQFSPSRDLPSPQLGAALTPASTFATTFSTTTNEVRHPRNGLLSVISGAFDDLRGSHGAWPVWFALLALPQEPQAIYSPMPSFQPHTQLLSPEPTAGLFASPEPTTGLTGAKTPGGASEAPTTMVGAAPLTPNFTTPLRSIRQVPMASRMVKDHEHAMVTQHHAMVMASREQGQPEYLTSRTREVDGAPKVTQEHKQQLVNGAAACDSRLYGGPR